jgi:hypothetical protein
MTQITFYDFDKLLLQYPKHINQTIYQYYSFNCDECQTIQKYCLNCQKYNCYCIPEINVCNVTECNKLLCCNTGIPICSINCSCPKSKNNVLCRRCWNIDFHDEVLEDIQNNGSNDEHINSFPFPTPKA